MAISETDVKNLGLVLVGARKLTSATDASKAGRLTSSLFELSRGGMFSLPVNWKFATTRAELGSTTDPSFGYYDHQFILPANCVRIVAQVDEDSDKIEYEHRREVYIDSSSNEHDVILTNQDACFIKYIRLRMNVAVWPVWFARLVALDLAILLCEPLKQDKAKKNQLLMLMTAPVDGWLAKAIQANGMEDKDVTSNGVSLDKGNTDVLDAATVRITDKYIALREE